MTKVLKVLGKWGKSGWYQATNLALLVNYLHSLATDGGLTADQPLALARSHD